MGEGSSRRRWSRIIRRTPRSEVDEELEFHIEARTREYVARGMEPEAARAQALARLGDLEGVRDECTGLLSAERRSEARRDWLRVSWLDFKLGFRMLVKYPALTLVGGLAMAFAIWIGAGTFELVRQAVFPRLPLDDPGRVVGIVVWDAASGGMERRLGHDFLSWREELASVRDLGAFRPVERNLITGDGVGEPVEVAEISASAFDVARVPPLLGRALVPADEEPGASPVVVLGHDIWQRRFGGDPDIVGRTLRLGRSRVTVVGVMPEGFAFPVAQNLWVPLRLNASEAAPRQGQGLRLFGRLAPGATLEQAQAELTALGSRAAAESPETHRHLRPEVLPYAKSIFPIRGFYSLGVVSINLFGVMLLILICGNVALLMFARAATRESEILVRNALGASRARITAQLFVEALVLGALAALIGLAAAGAGLRWVFRTVLPELGLSGADLPFWFTPSLSAATVGYTVLLTLFAAAIAGVIPALKVTGHGVESRLRQASAGGGGMRFGGIWTAVIVAQVAVTVAFPSFLYFTQRDASQLRAVDVGFPAEEYLSVRLEMDREPPPGEPDESRAGFLGRYRAALKELEQRLEARAGVAAVTFADRLPRMYHPHRLIELDEGGAAPMPPQWPGYRVSSVTVTPDFFDAVDAPILAGRGFHPGDLAADARSVIVNQSFVERVLGGRNPVGRHVRYLAFEDDDPVDTADPSPTERPWYEIVGVVRDMGFSAGDFDPKVAGFYHPGAPGDVYPTHMAVHVHGNPRALAQELRTVAAGVDPSLRLYDAMPLDQVHQAELRFYSFWFWMLVLVSAIALTLSLAGIYAVMSFAVSRRTREIGIRTALGADRRRLILAIFRRPLAQVAIGILAGAAIAGALGFGVSGTVTPAGTALIGAYALLMLGICMLACIVPTRRALGVEPTEALRSEG